MSEKDINIEYICNKTLLDKDDELVPIILEMIQESYRAGLSQSEIDNTMGLIEHNQMLKDQIRKQQEVIDKLELENKVLKEKMVAMVKPNYTYGIK